MPPWVVAAAGTLLSCRQITEVQVGIGEERRDVQLAEDQVALCTVVVQADTAADDSLVVHRVGEPEIEDRMLRASCRSRGARQQE